MSDLGNKKKLLDFCWCQNISIPEGWKRHSCTIFLPLSSKSSPFWGVFHRSPFFSLRFKTCLFDNNFDDKTTTMHGNDDDVDGDVCIREVGEHLITRPDIIAPCPAHPLPPDTRCSNIWYHPNIIWYHPNINQISLSATRYQMLKWRSFNAIQISSHINQITTKYSWLAYLPPDMCQMLITKWSSQDLSNMALMLSCQIDAL